MSALFRAGKRRTAHGPLSAGAVSRPTARAGVYLTDEVFLYRVVDIVASGMGQMVDLEDCYWLDVVRVPVTALDTRPLRLVTPARVEG